MDSRARIARLRFLTVRLERIAPSTERDVLLRNVRARISDVEIDVPASGAWRSRPPAKYVAFDWLARLLSF